MIINKLNHFNNLFEPAKLISFSTQWLKNRISFNNSLKILFLICHLNYFVKQGICKNKLSCLFLHTNYQKVFRVYKYHSFSHQTLYLFMQILVTGANSLLGHHVVMQL